MFLFIVDMEENNETYNDIPIAYCKKCLSLKVKVLDRDNKEEDYCDECGSTDIGYINIFDWEKMYKEKYNINF